MEMTTLSKVQRDRDRERDRSREREHIHERDREERNYIVAHGPHTPLPPAASEDLHAWSIYRQNLNSDFTDSALGSSDKSPLPYGNFQLRDTTVQSILNHPRYGPKSPLGSNMYTYLKFGLPRVFPPNSGSQRSQRMTGPGPGPGRGKINRGYRESSALGAGSSGYDSSDNETTRGRPMPPNLRKFRSESDFRAILTSQQQQQQIHHHQQHGSRPSSRGAAQGNIPLAALRQANSRASIAGTHMVNHGYHGNQQGGRHYGNRSHSEADLLGNEMGFDYDSRIASGSRSRLDQISMARRHSNTGLIYPNIQVHCVDVMPNIRSVSLTAKAGDLFAVMATSQREGTILMETLVGLRERLSGEILINGQSITKRGLRDMCGYVPSPDKSSLDPRMSVQSTLSFHAALHGPYDTSDLSEKVDILIEDLGLTAVRTTNISRLTHSEKQRLSVACQLLTQAAVLVLDQPTTNMDIFDTFFLVEYLRQWCSSGHIIIMTLQPPTFEILSMCSRVLLLSGGRTIFSGSRSDLPRHMGTLGYPCPPFKNPADYYLDLVTLDDLSAAAMLESSSRIESLANAWDQVHSDPPLSAPPAKLPPFTKRADICGQSIAVIKRFIVYKQPGSILSWISKFIAAAVLSLLIGCIYWDVPTSDPQLNLNDRLGYHYAVMSICLWPILLLVIRDIHEDRMYAEKDFYLGMYGRLVYILTQSFFSVLPSLCIWLAYLLPAHSMARLYDYSANNDTAIYIYMGFMLLYLMAIQTIALFCAHLVPTKITSSVLTILLTFFITSVGGYMVHTSNLPLYWSWLEIISPQKWLFPILVADEYSSEAIQNSLGTLFCRNKEIQHQEIIVQQPCPVPNGTQVLADHFFLKQNHIIDPNNPELSTLIGLVLVSLIFFVLTTFVFITNFRKMFIAKKKHCPYK